MMMIRMDPATVQVQKPTKNKLQNTAGDQTTHQFKIYTTITEKNRKMGNNCLATNPTQHTSNGVDSGTLAAPTHQPSLAILLFE